MAILRAIVKGERDPTQLAKLRDPGCRKSAEEIAEQLSGHWREDHLFSLEQSLKMHDAIDERIQAYETEIRRRLAEMERVDCEGKQAPPLKNKNKAKMIRYRGEEPMRQALYRMSGVDLTAIDAVGVGVVQIVLTEYGSDLSCFPTEKHFVSHVSLAPKKAVSGGKPLKKKAAAPAAVYRRRCAPQHYRCATATRRWALTSAIPHSASEPMSLLLLRLENWPR